MSNSDQTTASHAAKMHEMSLALWKAGHEALQLEEPENPLASHLHYSVNLSGVTGLASSSLRRE